MPKPLRVSPPESSSTTEVLAPRTQGRRSFSAAQKRHILSAADACVRGELGALLRREGVYSSQLTAWRRQLAAKGSAGLTPQRPGPSPKLDVKDREIVALERKVKKLERELRYERRLSLKVSSSQPRENPENPPPHPKPPGHHRRQEVFRPEQNHPRATRTLRGIEATETVEITLVVSFLTV